jgi:hypothetical protein
MADIEIPNPIDDVDPDKPFHIHDDGTANWAMKKLVALRDQMDERVQIATAEKARIDVWLEEVNKAFKTKAEYFESLLTDYAMRQRKFHERSTIPLTHGKLATRQGQPKWIVDADEFLMWAKTHRPELVRVKEKVWEEPDLVEMKKSLEIINERVVCPDTGELVDGVLIEDARLTVKITTETTTEVETADGV